MTSNSLRIETAYGVDGCRKGWFYFALVPGREPEWAVVEEIADLVAGANDSDRIFIDIPIGLPTGGEGRLCDSEARRKLSPHRTSSVFPVPVRSALTAETYDEANKQNREASGKGLPKQTYAIMPKIKEVDSLLRGSARARRAVREVHPEICFWALAGGSPMRHGKKTGRGFRERLTLLERFHASAVKWFDEIRTGYRSRDLADDDILDAMALAITASADRGALRTLPELPVEDSCGLPMEMVYAPASAFAITNSMTTRRTDLGREVETALGEVLAHVRGTAPLPCRIVDDPAAEHILALRKRMKLSRQKFADTFGLDVRAVQEWEQGRRVPDRAARVLLTVIDRDPEAVVRALGK